MSILATERLIPGGCRWDVNLRERRPATVDIDADNQWIQIRLTDADTGIGTAEPPCIHVRLGGDGTVKLRTHRAPPALLLSQTGGRLLPTVPGAEDITVMAEDDLLMLCSADVLEHLPAGFRTVIEGSYPASTPDILAALDDLMADVDGGAVVAVRRITAPAQNPSEGDQR